MKPVVFKGHNSLLVGKGVQPLPVQQGNSGGPTFDIYGRVIGVNSAILSPSGGSVGIGFAIPAETAKSITERLMRGESIERGYLGVQIGNLTNEYRESLGLPASTKGAYVVEVTPDGPAARGGLQVGDVVVSLNGRAIESSSELTRAVGSAKPGDTLRLELLREGRRQTINVRSGSRPANLETASAGSDDESGGPTNPGAAAGEVVEGLTVAPVNAALRSRFGLPADVQGLVVTAVGQQSRAARLGFQPGMVVIQANGRSVGSAADLKGAVEAVKSAGRPGILLLMRTPRGNSLLGQPAW